MMSDVGKSTCSRFKTGLYISYHGGNAVRFIRQRGFFLKDGRISGYFDTNYMTILQIEQILHGLKDQKSANFFNLEQVNFHVTLVKYVCWSMISASWVVLGKGIVQCFTRVTIHRVFVLIGEVPYLARHVSTDSMASLNSWSSACSATSYQSNHNENSKKKRAKDGKKKNWVSTHTLILQVSGCDKNKTRYVLGIGSQHNVFST